MAEGEITNEHVVFFTGGGELRVKVEQSVLRGLREGKWVEVEGTWINPDNVTHVQVEVGALPEGPESVVFGSP